MDQFLAVVITLGGLTIPVGLVSYWVVVYCDRKTEQENKDASSKRG